MGKAAIKQAGKSKPANSAKPASTRARKHSEPVKDSQPISDYQAFIHSKAQFGSEFGFEPLWMPDFLKDFQVFLNDWSIRKGRAAILADCGMGKSPMALVWGENVVRHTNKPVLLATPLAVTGQMQREAEKFGVDATISRDGKFSSKRIVITNYERLHYFDPSDFGGMVCDEAGILKNFDGATRSSIVEFMRTLSYRLLCSATAAPNDYDELGNCSEALGYLGYQDMLSMFFKQQTSKDHLGWGRTKYLLKPHATDSFWRWVCSFSRTIRKPSDYGFDDREFVLPPLNVTQHVIKTEIPRDGMLFSLPAMSLEEQREERRITLKDRCELVAELLQDVDCAVAWCTLNDEGDLLEQVIQGAVQVSGADSDDEKEEKLTAFSNGQIKKLVTKSVLAGWGLNWQHCCETTVFPSHSFEQFYQLSRRFWRFGQKRPVNVRIVTTQGEQTVVENLNRKAQQADEMFNSILRNTTNALHVDRATYGTTAAQLPDWL